MLNWLKGIGRQVLRAFGLGPKAEPLDWGKTVREVWGDNIHPSGLVHRDVLQSNRAGSFRGASN